MTSAGGPGAQWEPAGARQAGAREPAAGAVGQKGREEGGGVGCAEIPEPEPGRDERSGARRQRRWRRLGQERLARPAALRILRHPPRRAAPARGSSPSSGPAPAPSRRGKYWGAAGPRRGANLGGNGAPSASLFLREREGRRGRTHARSHSGMGGLPGRRPLGPARTKARLGTRRRRVTIILQTCPGEAPPVRPASPSPSWTVQGPSQPGRPPQAAIWGR